MALGRAQQISVDLSGDRDRGAAGLPSISANYLAERLAMLEARGLCALASCAGSCCGRCGAYGSPGRRLIPGSSPSTIALAGCRPPGCDVPDLRGRSAARASLQHRLSSVLSPIVAVGVARGEMLSLPPTKAQAKLKEAARERSEERRVGRERRSE